MRELKSMDVEGLKARGIIRDGDRWYTITSLNDLSMWFHVEGRFAPSLVEGWEEMIDDWDEVENDEPS